METNSTFATPIWNQVRRLLLALFLLGLAWSASAKTVYVNSATGSDTNSGDSPTTAWASFTTALSRLASGDVLNCSGSWTITSLFTCSTPNITVLGNGVSTLIIRGNTTSGTLVFTGSGTVFRGFDLQNPYAPTGEAHAMVAIRGNNSLVADHKIHDYASISTYDAVIFMVNANSSVFSNLFFYNMKDRDLFRVWGVKNIFTSCTFSNCTNPGSGPHADIFQTWWTGSPCWSNVIERCYFVNSSQATFQLKGTPDNVNCHPGEEGYWSIRNNVFNNCKAWPVMSTDNLRFYNNLLYKSGTGQYPLFFIADPCLTRGRYYNNVLVETYCELGTSPSTGNNAFTRSDASWGGTGDFVTTEAACKFVNPAAGNFRLQAGSSLIGKGANLSGDANMSRVDYDGNTRPASGAWDLGPFQFGASGGGNQPPIVSAGSAVNLYLPTNSVTLNGLASDPEGAPLALGWSRISGPATMTFGSPSAAVTTATFPTNLGTYVLRLTANDGTNSSYGEVSVTVNPPIVPPVASFQAESGSITAPFTVTSGAISQPSETDLASGGRAVYQFTIPTAGNYTISAVVNAPNAGADSVFINVDGMPTDPDMIWDISPLTSGFETRTVSWRGNGTVDANEFNPKVFPFSAGLHTLTVVGREGGVSLDRFEVRSTGTTPSAPASPSNLRVVGSQ